MPQDIGNPFRELDQATVTGVLRGAASLDPDVLHARKTALGSVTRVPRIVGGLCLLGAAAVLVLAPTPAGAVPLGLAGAWLWRLGSRNRRAVEAAYLEFTRRPHG